MMEIEELEKALEGVIRGDRIEVIGKHPGGELCYFRQACSSPADNSYPYILVHEHQFSVSREPNEEGYEHVSVNYRDISQVNVLTRKRS